MEKLTHEEANMFRLILVLIVVGLIALAFYLGWVHITANNSGDQSNVTLSINKAKVKESVGALREKVEGKGANPEGKEANPKGIKETVVTGTVETMGSGEMKLKTGSDQEMTVVIARETDMQGDPKKGDSVTVSYITVDNRHVATSIRKD
jgi:hypothetical protein